MSCSKASPFSDKMSQLSLFSKTESTDTHKKNVDTEKPQLLKLIWKYLYCFTYMARMMFPVIIPLP